MDTISSKTAISISPFFCHWKELIFGATNERENWNSLSCSLLLLFMLNFSFPPCLQFANISRLSSNRFIILEHSLKSPRESKSWFTNHSFCLLNRSCLYPIISWIKCSEWKPSKQKPTEDNRKRPIDLNRLGSCPWSLIKGDYQSRIKAFLVNFSKYICSLKETEHFRLHKFIHTYMVLKDSEIGEPQESFISTFFMKILYSQILLHYLHILLL